MALRETMDGVSFAPWLIGRMMAASGDDDGAGRRGDAEARAAAAPRAAWKDAALIEYQSIRTTITATDPQCDAACQLDAYGRVQAETVADDAASMMTTAKAAAAAAAAAMSSAAVGPNFHPHGLAPTTRLSRCASSTRRPAATCSTPSSPT